MNDTELLLAVLGGLMLVCLLVLGGVVLTGRAFTTLADTLHGMVEMALMVAQRQALPLPPPASRPADLAAVPPAGPPAVSLLAVPPTSPTSPTSPGDPTM